MTITNNDWLEISKLLEKQHALFSEMWHMGKPYFTDDVATASVIFSTDGNFIEFVFNPQYWESLTTYDRAFVVGHECLHVILNHGARARNLVDKSRANIALDIPINHLLVTSFGFDRSKISNANDLCWVDTVFEDHPELSKIPTNESFEFYYQLVKPSSTIKAYTVDDHSKLPENVEKVIEKLSDRLTPEEKETLKTLIEKHFYDPNYDEKAGKGYGSWTTVKVDNPGRKKKWETVIKNWSLKYLRTDMEEKEQWARIARRLVLLPKTIILPSEMEDDTIEKDTLPVFFFMDTSGSCYKYKERFFKAAMSLPKDRFKIRLFCFDNDVKETTLESKKIYGGGGTSFKIIEEYIQKLMKQEQLDYPEAVFIITDGDGDAVNPYKPDRWYWFLTPYGIRHLIPKNSKVYDLEDFE